MSEWRLTWQPVVSHPQSILDPEEQHHEEEPRDVEHQNSKVERQTSKDVPGEEDHCDAAERGEDQPRRGAHEQQQQQQHNVVTSPSGC